MIGLGTIINVLAIIIGGLIGLGFKRLINDSISQTMTKAMGVSTMFIGIAGTLEKMMHVESNQLVSSGTLMMIISFALGSFVGELMDIDSKFDQFGEYLKQKTKSDKDTGFVNAFVVASLTVCIGAMAIVGSIQDGLLQDPSTLIAKSLLDFIIIMVMASSLGKGTLFSAIPVGLVQGSMTLLATFLEPFMTPMALSNISLTGSMLIFCVGVNLIWERKIKVANMLPTLLFAFIFAFLPI